MVFAKRPWFRIDFSRNLRSTISGGYFLNGLWPPEKLVFHSTPTTGANWLLVSGSRVFNLLTHLLQHPPNTLEPRHLRYQPHWAPAASSIGNDAVSETRKPRATSAAVWRKTDGDPERAGRTKGLGLMEQILPHLGCPKGRGTVIKPTFWGIPSGAGFFPSTALTIGFPYVRPYLTLIAEGGLVRGGWLTSMTFLKSAWFSGWLNQKKEVFQIAGWTKSGWSLRTLSANKIQTERYQTWTEMNVKTNTVWKNTVLKKQQKKYTLQGTNISHLGGKTPSTQKCQLGGDMLVIRKGQFSNSQVDGLWTKWIILAYYMNPQSIYSLF